MPSAESAVLPRTDQPAKVNGHVESEDAHGDSDQRDTSGTQNKHGLTLDSEEEIEEQLD